MTGLLLGLLGGGLMLVGWLLLGMPFSPWTWQVGGAWQRGVAQIQRLVRDHRGRALAGFALTLAGITLAVMTGLGVFDAKLRTPMEHMYDTITRSPDELIPRGR